MSGSGPLVHRGPFEGVHIYEDVSELSELSHERTVEEWSAEIQERLEEGWGVMTVAAYADFVSKLRASGASIF